MPGLACNILARFFPDLPAGWKCGLTTGGSLNLLLTYRRKHRSEYSFRKACPRVSVLKFAATYLQYLTVFPHGFRADALLR